MDEQLILEFVSRRLGLSVAEVTVASSATHPVWGMLIEAVTPTGHEVQLVPLWVGGLHHPVREGEAGLGLFAGVDADCGYYLSGRTVLGLLAPGWDGTTTRLHARDAALELVGDAGVHIGADTLPAPAAARTGDAVQIQIGPDDGPQVTALAVSLLTTGLFTPNPVAPLVPPPATVATPIPFTGTITGGSNSVTVGN